MPSAQKPSAGRPDATSPARSPESPASGSHASHVEPDQLTLHQFLSKLVASGDARSAFEADPRTSLDEAGLGDMSVADVLHASSLVLDYAPAEVVREYHRSLQSSFEKLAADSGGAAAISELLPPFPQNTEMTELTMLDFSGIAGNGDAPFAYSPAHNVESDKDSHNGIDIHDNKLISVDGGSADSASAAFAGAFTHAVDGFQSDLANGPAEFKAAVTTITGSLPEPSSAAGEISATAASLPGAGEVTAALSSGAAQFQAGAEQFQATVSGVADSLNAQMASGAEQFQATLSGVTGSLNAQMASGAEKLSGQAESFTAALTAAGAGLPSPAAAPAELSAGAEQFQATLSGATDSLTAQLSSAGSELPSPDSLPGASELHAALSGAAGNLSGQAESFTATLSSAAASNGLPTPSDAPGAVAGALSEAASGNLPSPSDIPVIGSMAGTAAGSLPIPGGLPAPASVPALGNPVETVTDHVQVPDAPAPTNLPVVGDVAGHLPAGAVASGLNDVTSHLPSGDQVDAVASHLPTHDVTSHLPVNDVASHLPVGAVASHVPGPDQVLNTLPTHDAPLNVVAAPAADAAHHVEGVAGHGVTDLGIDVH